MPKEKISITVDKEILDLVDELLQSGKFRNRSHAIEYGVKKFLDEENGSEGK